MKNSLRYLVASASIVFSLYLSSLNNLLMRKVLNQGLSCSMCLFIRQLICVLGILIFLILKRKAFRSKYWKLHLVRSLGVPFASILWSQAIKTEIPLYLCGFMSLVISVFSMIIARITLGERWPFSGWFLMLSTSPILYDLFFTKYGYEVLLLLLASLIYSILDSINLYILNPKAKGLLSVYIKHKGAESPMIINLWDHFMSLALYSIFSFKELFYINIETISLLPLFLFMGINLALSMPLIWFAYRIKDISSMQFLRITEPIFSGFLGEIQMVPTRIVLGITFFGLTGLVTFIKGLI